MFYHGWSVSQQLWQTDWTTFFDQYFDLWANFCKTNNILRDWHNSAVRKNISTIQELKFGFQQNRKKMQTVILYVKCVMYKKKSERNSRSCYESLVTSPLKWDIRHEPNRLGLSTKAPRNMRTGISCLDSPWQNVTERALTLLFPVSTIKTIVARLLIV